MRIQMPNPMAHLQTLRLPLPADSQVGVEVAQAVNKVALSLSAAISAGIIVPLGHLIHTRLRPLLGEDRGLGVGHAAASRPGILPWDQRRRRLADKLGSKDHVPWGECVYIIYMIHLICMSSSRGRGGGPRRVRGCSDQRLDNPRRSDHPTSLSLSPPALVPYQAQAGEAARLATEALDKEKEMQIEEAVQLFAEAARLDPNNPAFMAALSKQWSDISFMPGACSVVYIYLVAYIYIIYI